MGLRLSAEDRGLVYGDYAEMAARNTKSRDDLRDRAAYVYVTGQFPSHLRTTWTGALRTLTSYFRKPVAFDGRSGHMKLDQRVAEDLELEAHPMVKEVRAKMAEGYFIQPSLGYGKRRPYWRVFMFRQDGDNVVDRITVQGDGSVKAGWT